MVVIIDYNVGNVKSVLNACNRIGLNAILSRNIDDIKNATGIILPGVGSFPIAMENLKKYNLIEALNERRKAGIPILGICLGMQILFEKGFETQETQGLGYLKGNVNLIKTTEKLPHMGWNQLYFNQKNPILKNILEQDDVYFVHSYMAEFNSDEVICYTEYGDIKIPALVGKNNVVRLSVPSRKKRRSWTKNIRSMEGDSRMLLIPAIDLKDGEAVRLYKGDYNQKTVYSKEPEKLAKQFEKMGAKLLHIVDLDGAKDGKCVNFDVIKKIRKNVSIPIELGGGIRNKETVQLYLDKIGIDRVILGTSAINNPTFLKEMLELYGPEKIVVGVDSKDGYVSASGWLKTSSIKYIDFIKQLEKIGVKYIVATDISKDGTLLRTKF